MSLSNSGDQTSLQFLRLDDVLEIQSLFSERWEIWSPRDTAAWEKRLDALPVGLRETYRDLWQRQAEYVEREKPIPTALESKWYELLGASQVSGLVHSQKYPFLLDTAAFAVAVYRSAGLTGAVIDVGCHTGYHVDTYESLLKTDVFGVDRSRSAIETARSKLGPKRRIELAVGDVTEVKLPQAALAICSDAFPSDQAGLTVLLRRLREVVSPDGYIVLSGNLLYLKKGLLAQVCKFLALRMVAHLVTGGWVGAQNRYDNRLFVVLSENQGRSVPRDLYLDWSEYGFPGYANDLTTPWERKTQAFFRALMLPSR